MSYSDKEKEKAVIPEHVGIIMDGNRRWARERNLPTIDGHLQGYKKIKIIPEYFFIKGVKILSVFAFSTENWSRAQNEVNYLMKLMRKALVDDFEEYDAKGFCLKISGRIKELPGDLPEICLNAIDNTKDNTVGILNICLNYGGRAEIVDAIKKMMKKGITREQVHEGMVKKYLYNPELADPDIIVRTSGEKRTSGFQLWESAYSEFMFIKKYWPDFEKADVDIILKEFAGRKRRFGGN
ncbi:di-trans,poly-cis-decaprenylcistransferase [bacterium]|nr:di-trans,poly-cis-decaprenylcistransferase [bacterium]